MDNNRNTTPLNIVATPDDALCFMHNLKTSLIDHDQDLRTLKEGKMLHRFAEAARHENWQQCHAVLNEQSHKRMAEISRSDAQAKAQQNVDHMFAELTDALENKSDDELYDYIEERVYATGNRIEVIVLLATNMRIRFSVDEHTHEVCHGILECFGFNHAYRVLDANELFRFGEMFQDKIHAEIDSRA